MKKTYISPDSIMVNLVTENMIAASVGIHDGEQADQWSHKRGGWSSEDWSGAEEDVEE